MLKASNKPLIKKLEIPTLKMLRDKELEYQKQKLKEEEGAIDNAIYNLFQSVNGSDKTDLETGVLTSWIRGEYYARNGWHWYDGTEDDKMLKRIQSKLADAGWKSRIYVKVEEQKTGHMLWRKTIEERNVYLILEAK